jgi:hypothetical protein
MDLIDVLSKIVNEMENQRKQVGDFLRESDSFTSLELTDQIKEEKIIIPVDSMQMNSKIAGVGIDLVKKSFHGAELMFLRSMAAISSYKDNQVLSTEYYPEDMPNPDVRTVPEIFSYTEIETDKTVERLIKEISIVREAIEKFEPDSIFLNGPLIPDNIVISEESLLYERYKQLIDNYNKLFDSLKNKKTVLAGIVQDSRGTRFCEVLNNIFLAHIHPNTPIELKIVLNKSNDVNLLNYVLQKNERSFVFPYSSKLDHPILEEINERNNIFVFYLRTSEFDKPIRIEFFSNDPVDLANRIASILLANYEISNHSMPSVIMEANQKAKLSDKDTETFMQ